MGTITINQKYDSDSFNKALSAKEPVIYRLEQKTTEVFEGSRKEIKTTFYLYNTSKVAIALKRFWCWLTFQTFDATSYDKAQLASTIYDYVFKNPPASNSEAVKKNIEHLQARFQRKIDASLGDDLPTDHEALVKARDNLRNAANSLKSL